MNFEPTIISFLCNWCSYTGADLAGTSRMKYAHNIRIIRLMCSGRVDPTFVLESFKKGADGVLICGCHPVIAIITREITNACAGTIPQKYIKQLGIEPERLHWNGSVPAKGNNLRN